MSFPVSIGRQASSQLWSSSFASAVLQCLHSRFSHSAISAAQSLGNIEHKGLHMVSPVLSIRPGLEKV